MGSIGDYDNAMIESWGPVQTELLNRQRCRTPIELANALFEYLRFSTTGAGDTPRWACSRRSNTRSGSALLSR
jgi:hypothetical protein